MAGIGSHHQPVAITHDWLTPPHILEALGEFDLDPCASRDRPWDTAKTHITPPANGLKLPWFGRVWLNPPYGRETGVWLEKLFRHGNGIALTFARTETQMFVDWVWGHATALLFLDARLHFHRPKTGERAPENSGGPSVLVAFGEENVEALETSKLSGIFVTDWTVKGGVDA